MGFVQKKEEKEMAYVNVEPASGEQTIVYKPTVVVDPKEFGLEADKAKEVESAFLPVIAERDSLSTEYTAIVNREMSKELTQDARDLRLKLVKVRTNTDRIHKTAKAFYLAGGRFVDAWRNKNVASIETMEENLVAIENHYVMIENKRLDQLESDRRDQLGEVTENPAMYPLRDMDEDAFNNLYEGLKLVKEKQIELAAAAEAERKAAEQKAIEDQKRIRKENERLKAEAIENERKAQAQKAESERLAKIEREKQEKALAAERAKIAKERADHEAKLEAERKAKAEAEAKLAEIARKEADEKKRKVADERKAKRAPDKTKLEVLIDKLQSIEFPACEDDDLQEFVDYAKRGIQEIGEYLENGLQALA